MILAVIILAIWLGIGAAFGWQRAHERYVEYLDEFPYLRDAGDKSHRMGAIFAATRTLLGWSLLGIFSGILFAFWYIWGIYIKEQAKK